LVNPLLFFVLVVLLFPLAMTPETALLKKIAPGVIWVAALLANLLSIEHIFAEDAANGCLEQWLLHPSSLTMLVSAKVIAHWLLTGLPLLLITPVLATMLDLNMLAILVLEVSLLLGTPILSLLGATVAALTAKLQSGGLLLALLILPLAIPVLIFGAGSVIMVESHHGASGLLALLAAGLIIAAMSLPFAIAQALRISHS